MKYARQKGSAQWASTCYGADICDGTLVVVRATRTRAAINCVRIDPTDSSFLAEAKKSSAVVAGCLSERESFSRWLNAPFRSTQKAQQVFPSLLDIQLPFPLDQCVYAFLPCGLTETGTARALAIAALSSEVGKKIEAYQQAGMDPVVMDQEGVALWSQSIREVPISGDATRVVVSLYGKFASIAIGRSEEFISSHSVRQNAGQIDRVLRAQIKDTAAPIEWAWTGPGASDANVIQDLQSNLGPSWPGKSTTHDEPDTFLARAAATRALLPGPLRCNLRIDSFKHPLVAARARSFLKTTSLLFLCAGLLLSGAGLTARTIARNRLNEARLSFSTQIDKLAGYRVTSKGEQAVKEAAKALKERSKDSRPFDELLSPSLPFILRTILDTGKENNLTYESLTLRKDSVSIVGTCSAWNQCENLSKRLKELKYSVRLDRRESSSDGKIYFSIVPGGPGE